MKCWARISRSRGHIDPWVALVAQEHPARNISCRRGDSVVFNTGAPRSAEKQVGRKLTYSAASPCSRLLRKLRMWGLGPGTAWMPLCGTRLVRHVSHLLRHPVVAVLVSFEVSCGSKMSSMTIFDLGSPAANLS
jgi:hypothetical protein